MREILAAQDLSLAYGKTTVVREVSISVERGDRIGIIGESGSGKTTLARALLGLTAPAAGDVRFKGESLGALGRAEYRDYRASVQPVFQDGVDAFNPRMSVRVVLEEGRRAARRAGRDPARVDDLLRSVGLGPEIAGRLTRELSGGQRQRVGIARALATEADLLILDEPTSALDVTVQATILDLLDDLIQRRGLSIVLISHNLTVIDRLCARAHVMRSGRIIESGAVSTLLREPEDPYTRSLIDAIPAARFQVKDAAPERGRISGG